MPSFTPSGGAPRGTSVSLEQYVEAIADLLTRDKVCSVSEIAEQVKVSRPAASRAVRELSEKQLVEHRAYGFVDLTSEGQTLADRLTARHEALYAFLVEVLDFEPEWADQEACRLEHLVEDKIVTRLEHLRRFFVENDELATNWHRRLKRDLS